MHSSLLLISLAVGYWVLTVSQNQSKALNLLGRILGALILIVSLGGLICSAVCGYGQWKHCAMPHQECAYPMMKGGMPCHGEMPSASPQK